jgi:hypothetical protein
MACFQRQLVRVIATGVLTFMLPASWSGAQNNRLRGVLPPQSTAPAPAPVPSAPTTAAQPAPLTAPAAPVSMLQQPAREAQIVFSGDHLSIRADNSSLSAILHQVAASSGMRITGLSGDERVFGTFGPGAPRDVLSDLLNGTAYNVALIGDLDNGAPRELVLTAVTGGAAPSPSAQATPDETMSEQETSDVTPPPPPELTPTQPMPPSGPGVRSPQQLFEQLQRMRQAQQQGQDPQQQQQQQQQQSQPPQQ